MNTSDVVTPTPSTQTSPQRPAGLLLVDDHDLVRLGFRALVESQVADTALAVFEARNLAEALALYTEHKTQIGVVVLDLGLPDTQGLSGVTEFRSRFPEAAVVVLSGTASPALVQGSLALGVRAFLPKSGDLAEVARFVHACALHGPEAASRLLMPANSAGFSAHANTQVLTPRQQQILQWLLQGKSNREIAELAFLSEGTVKNHVSTLLLLFGARSRAQLISHLRA